MHTPWGTVQHETKLADGITIVSTASHGGIVLSSARAKKVAHIKNFLNDPRFWEEDCDWAIPYVVFKDEINEPNKDRHLKSAYESIKYWNPELAKSLV